MIFWTCSNIFSVAWQFLPMFVLQTVAVHIVRFGGIGYDSMKQSVRLLYDATWPWYDGHHRRESILWWYYASYACRRTIMWYTYDYIYMVRTILILHGIDRHIALIAFYIDTWIYIYIYIKWTVFVNVTTKSAQHEHARMIAIIVENCTYDLSLDFFQQLHIYIYI